MTISPAFGIRKPAIMRNSVVLPDPDGPRTVRNAPVLRSKLASITAGVPEKDMLTSRTDTATSGATAAFHAIEILAGAAFIPFKLSHICPRSAGNLVQVNQT